MEKCCDFSGKITISTTIQANCPFMTKYFSDIEQKGFVKSIWMHLSISIEISLEQGHNLILNRE